MSNCVRDSKQTREHCLHWPVWDDRAILFCCRCSLDQAEEHGRTHE